MREAMGMGVPVVDRIARDRRIAEIQAALSADTFVLAWTAGQAMGLEAVIALALEEPAQPKTWHCQLNSGTTIHNMV